MPGQLARFSIKESADGFFCVSQRAEESSKASSTRIPRIPLGAKTQILAEHRGSAVGNPPSATSTRRRTRLISNNNFWNDEDTAITKSRRRSTRELCFGHFSPDLGSASHAAELLFIDDLAEERERVLEPPPLLVAVLPRLARDD